MPYISLFSLLPEYLPQTRTSFFLSWKVPGGKGALSEGTWAGRNLVLQAGQGGALGISMVSCGLSPGFCVLSGGKRGVDGGGLSMDFEQVWPQLGCCAQHL